VSALDPNAPTDEANEIIAYLSPKKREGKPLPYGLTAPKSKATKGVRKYRRQNKRNLRDTCNKAGVPLGVNQKYMIYNTQLIFRRRDFSRRLKFIVFAYYLTTF
jgi:hypothetical protein